MILVFKWVAYVSKNPLLNNKASDTQTRTLLKL